MGSSPANIFSFAGTAETWRTAISHRRASNTLQDPKYAANAEEKPMCARTLILVHVPKSLQQEAEAADAM